MAPEFQEIAVYAPAFAAPLVGSLLARCIVQFSTKGDPLGAPSACSGCGAIVPLGDLVPLLSWCVNSGCCRDCGARAGTFRRLVELSSITVALWAATVVTGWQLWITCFLGWTLLGLALVDYRHFVLPDVISLPLLIAGLIVAAAGGMPRLGDAVIGAVVGFAAFTAVAWLYRRARGRDGLGLGDAKLLGAIGAWVGWVELPAIVLLASVAALIVAIGQGGGVVRLDDTRPVAFGPYLGLAMWLTVLYGPFLG